MFATKEPASVRVWCLYLVLRHVAWDDRHILPTKALYANRCNFYSLLILKQNPLKWYK